MDRWRIILRTDDRYSQSKARVAIWIYLTYGFIISLGGNMFLGRCHYYYYICYIPAEHMSTWYARMTMNIIHESWVLNNFLWLVYFVAGRSTVVCYSLAVLSSCPVHTWNNKHIYIYIHISPSAKHGFHRFTLCILFSGDLSWWIPDFFRTNHEICLCWQYNVEIWNVISIK